MVGKDDNNHRKAEEEFFGEQAPTGEYDAVPRDATKSDSNGVSQASDDIDGCVNEYDADAVRIASPHVSIYDGDEPRDLSHVDKALEGDDKGVYLNPFDSFATKDNITGFEGRVKEYISKVEDRIRDYSHIKYGAIKQSIYSVRRNVFVSSLCTIVVVGATGIFFANKINRLEDKVAAVADSRESANVKFANGIRDISRAMVGLGELSKAVVDSQKELAGVLKNYEGKDKRVEYKRAAPARAGAAANAMATSKEGDKKKSSGRNVKKDAGVKKADKKSSFGSKLAGLDEKDRAGITHWVDYLNSKNVLAGIVYKSVYDDVFGKDKELKNYLPRGPLRIRVFVRKGKLEDVVVLETPLKERFGRDNKDFKGKLEDALKAKLTTPKGYPSAEGPTNAYWIKGSYKI